MEVIMKIGNMSQAVAEYLPTKARAAEQISDSMHRIVRNLNKVAIPALALYAASNVPGAEAGFLLAGLVYVGTNIAGGAMIVAGAVTAPTGIGTGLIAAGTATIAAAPYTLAATLPTPTP